MDTDVVGETEQREQSSEVMWRRGGTGLGKCYDSVCMSVCVSGDRVEGLSE